ncbi:winged helix-turn-helix domain-containing protein [Marinicella meishanensis]|uniref:winged helix-turn-helix domain-containing protein n=1 Tax=Marinicella meishanensis TaxID=2873263 RepID=UPI001CBBD5B8|nr:winged helix-turn-helix domain-containing protein [Marinicella sp. NBU2979]
MSLQIGPYEVDPDHNKISRLGQPVKWGEKAHSLFILLLSQAPKTISKETIFDHVWKGRVVTENSLYKVISKLRPVLQEDGLEIESVFGEGYRLIEQPGAADTAKPKPAARSWPWLGLTLALVFTAGLIWLGWQHRQQQQLMQHMVQLQQIMAVTRQAFISQINRRNELGELLSQRFTLQQADSWEKRFYQLHDQMNEQERFLCQQTRAYTEGPLYENNAAALALLQQHPAMVQELPLAPELITHLTIWLNKYERVFRDSEKMCLLYVGVEDGAAFPAGFDQQLADWITAKQ